MLRFGTRLERHLAVPWIAAQVVVIVLASAFVTAVAGLRKSAMVLVAFATLATPWLLPSGLPLARAVAVHGTLFIVLRAIDLARDPTPRSILWRWLFLIVLADLRRLQPVERRLDAAALRAALGYFVLAAVGVVLVDRGARWLGGVVLIYAFADGAQACLRFAMSLFGKRVPVMHRVPIAATSVRAFWSRHWNLTVSWWLREHVHEPLRRRGWPTFGLVAAFLVSALVHLWLVFVPIGLGPGITMAAFFVVQGILAALEGPLGVTGWPKWSRHAWTLAAVLIPSPLFVEPFVQVVLG